MTTLAAAQEAEPAVDEPASFTDSGTPTLGGKQFWTDHFIYDSWRIQENAVTGHFRLLDDHNDRRASGSYKVCRERFEQLRGELQLPPLKPEIVITLHAWGDHASPFRASAST